MSPGEPRGTMPGASEAAGQPPCRPSDLARLLLAGPGLRSRQRARDQQADRAGLELKREALERLTALDPEPQDLDAAFDQIIQAMGPPYGPIRGICLSVRGDWEAVCTSPQFMSWLLQEAMSEDTGRRKRKQRDL